MKSYLFIAAAAIALFGCESQPSPTPSSPVPSSTSNAPTNQAIAKVSLIEDKPVFVASQQNPQSKEIDAQLGMDLYVADTVRTEANGKTQVEFNNGVGFRIGGDSILQIQPQNRLHLKSGKMITWIKPGLKVPTEISTPYATAAIRGTTAFVEIPKDINQGVRFFSWEGTVSVKLPNQSKEIVLLTGEEILVKPNDTKPPVVRRLSLKEWKDHAAQKSSLLRSFKMPLPTQPIIDKLIPGQASLETASQKKKS
ncbi:FecR family protein [Pseudanabaena yagii]|uniref:FecR domain-containing protein n=1 Tax=Pseudanabaena yagii GIHE-NHR1 TaxID=2722753 RepID=A0ABX1LVH8_9CYAN|nr:FecR family protein [Pseudanabaena yagii]NMF60173.1 FecR domain-containing protein [Pseudanabaena yagii GIHE-NHR1]